MKQAQAYQPLPDAGAAASEWALDVLVGARKPDAWITAVQDPGEEAHWRGGRYAVLNSILKTATGSGHYINQVLFADGCKRSDDNAEAGLFVAFDDVGDPKTNPRAKMDKGWLDLMGPTPTLMVETSEANYQYFYALDTPAPIPLFRGLITALKTNEETAGGFRDASGVGRYLRLPSGMNPKPGRGGFVTRLIEGAGVKYALQELADAFQLGIIRPIDRPEPHKQDGDDVADPCPIEEIEALLLGPDAPLRNDERFDDRDVYVAIVHHVKGASAGSEEALQIINAWGAMHHQDPIDDPERRWNSVHSPRTGASALWSKAFKLGGYEATALWFKLHPESPESKALGAPPESRTSQKLIPHVFVENRILPPREWVVPGWIPMRKVTLLQGDGGDGKTLLMRQLQASVALGEPWIGLPVEEMISVGFYTEDDDYDVDEGQAALDTHYGRFIAGTNRMFVFERDGEENELIRFVGRERKAEPTPFYRRVREAILDLKGRLLNLDVAVDLYGGNEIVRTEVRALFRLIRLLCREMNNGAAVLSMHVSQSGIRSDGGHSGSTDWSNAARSRLYLKRVETEKGEIVDPDARILTRKKAQYAPLGDTVALRWQRGLLVPDLGIDHSDRPSADEVFLTLLDAVLAEKQRPSPTVNSGNYAPKMFMQRPALDRHGYGKPDFEKAMQRLMQAQRIEISHTGGPPSKQREILIRAQPGRETNEDPEE